MDKLDDTVNKYNKKYHRTIKMKPVDVKSGMYIEYGVEHNDKHPKLKVGDHVRISKYKTILAKGSTPNWSEVVKKVKKYCIMDISY